MIAADTSAIMAILLDEDDGPSFHSAMRKDGEVLVSTATAVELLTVAMGRGDAIYQAAAEFLARPFIRLVPPDEAQLWAAAAATVKAAIRPGSTSATLSPTCWRQPAASPCCSRATILRGPI